MNVRPEGEVTVPGIGLLQRLDELVGRALEALRRAVDDERAALRGIPILVAVAAAFHFPSLGAFTLSPDDEYAAFRTHPDVWITQGRWTAYLVERFVVPLPTVPYLSNALFCVCAALSYTLLVRTHGLTIGWRTYAAFPIFCAFPTWAFIAEFYANLPSASLGLLLAGVAAFVFQRVAVLPLITQGERSSWVVRGIGVAFLSLMLGTAMGAYQSYVFAFVNFGLGIVVLTALSRPELPLGHLCRMLVWLVVVTGTGAGLYTGIQKFALAAIHAQVAYIDNFVQPELLQEPGARAQFVFDEVREVYSGSKSIYGASIGALGAVVVLGALAIVCAARTPLQLVRKALLLFLAAATLAIPVAMMAVAPHLPLRALVGVPYAAWLFAMLSLTNRLHIPRIAGALAVCTSCFQIAYLLTLYAASLSITGNHDRLLAEAVYQRIAAANEGFDRQRTYLVDFYGSKSVSTSRYPIAPTSTLGRTFFDWDGGNAGRIVSYMNLVGYDNLSTIGTDDRRRMTPEFAEMPAWPAKDCVKVVDGITLVKLGGYPDSFHPSP